MKNFSLSEELRKAQAILKARKPVDLMAEFAARKRRKREDDLISTAGHDPSARMPKQKREKVIQKGLEIHKARRSAKQGVRKRVHTERLRLAMPAWANRAAMEAIYAEAARMTVESGKPFEVDHIVPLLGKTVSGLHVEYNLRIVHRSVNRRKCNKLMIAA